jgi:hypothetical protein
MVGCTDSREESRGVGFPTTAKREINARFGRFRVRSGSPLYLPAVYADPANDFDVCDVRGKVCFCRGGAMAGERLPFFLAHARGWRAAADALRAAGVRQGGPALSVWREAAWCHLLSWAGKYASALTQPRVVCRDVTGASPPAVPVAVCEFEALDLAAAR